ncbi:MAG: pilus (MSHA type) biogenesis protein MshL [Mariprofundaceae bacterium]
MNIIKVVAIAMVTVLTGCQAAHRVPEVVENPRYQENLDKTQRAQTDSLHKSIVDNVQDFSRMQDELRKDVEVSSKPKKEFVALAPTYNPLDNVNVTLDVNNGDIQHVLQALARQAGMNLLMHPNLSDSKRRISLHFFDVPASTVFEDVLRITDLHGEVKGNVLIVNPLEEKIISVGFIETVMTGNFSSGGDVLGSSQGGSGGDSGGSGGSGGGSSTLSGNFSITGSSAANSNPYDQLESMLKRMVGDTNSGNRDDVVSASTLREVGIKSILQSAKQVETAKYVLNRRAGTLYIQAKPSVVSAVTKIVERYKEVLGRQVLLETQILEVRLDDKFQYGIDWSNLRGHFGTSYTGEPQLGSVSGTLPGDTSSTTHSITIPTGGMAALGRMLGISFANSGLGITVGLLKGYGDVHVLSNPTIRAMNSQPSLISVGRTHSYISKTSSTSAATAASTGSLSSDVTVNSVFNGLILGVIPSIDDDGEITLSIHPIQSEVDQISIDTFVDVGGGGKITLPRVDIKEISTTIKMHDGDTVILGGLIDKGKSASNEGVPLLSDIPLFGYLFKSKKGQTSVREMVIVIRAHLL